jgi:hypothetical protein
MTAAGPSLSPRERVVVDAAIFRVDPYRDQIRWGVFTIDAGGFRKAVGASPPGLRHEAVIPPGAPYLFGTPALYTASSRAQAPVAVVRDVARTPAIATREGRKRATALAVLLHPNTSPAGRRSSRAFDFASIEHAEAIDG